MRTSFSLFVLTVALLSPPATAAETALRRVRFAEAKAVRELPGLPPKIEMTVEVYCNETVLKPIREEVMEEKSRKTTIVVGALVKEILYSSCAGEKKDVKVIAGNAFSGREYEVSRIKTGEH